MFALTQSQLFEGVKVRYAWDAENEEWLFSVADVCNVLAESVSKAPSAYWRKLKQRLIAEGSEVVTNCHRLKLMSSDGKRYLTDCFTTRDTLRLIQSIPSPKAEPFKMWLAQVGLPSIVIDINGSREIVMDGENGLIEYYKEVL